MPEFDEPGTKYDPKKAPPVSSPTPQPTGPLYTPTPPGGFIGPVAPLPIAEMPLGRPRFDEFLRTAPQGIAPQSEEWDKWLLGALSKNAYLRAGEGKSREQDPEFFQLIEGAALSANQRQQKRDKDRREREAQLAPVVAQEERSLQRAGRKPKPAMPKALPTPPPGEFIINSEGEVVRRAGTRPEVEAPAVGSQSQVTAPPTEDEKDTGNVRDGNYVFISFQDVPGPASRSASEAERTQYMLVSEAEKIPFYWSPQQIAGLQVALENPVTGFADEDIKKLWKQALDSAAGMTSAGRNIDPMTIFQANVAALVASRKASRGRGGGGSGSAGYSKSQVKAFFNSVMKQQVGREATDAESASFFSAFNPSGDVDPEQFATDWIRANLTGEAGAYSAVNYYDIVQQLLSGGGG